jgi:hypothetical protein
MCSTKKIQKHREQKMSSEHAGYWDMLHEAMFIITSAKENDRITKEEVLEDMEQIVGKMFKVMMCYPTCTSFFIKELAVPVL